MSAIYNLEPQPTASVIFHTTQGELSVELFAKQTPLTCRNFLQLCLDGYYDNTIFHRLVPGFILQGGDPTGTGNGGESIYDGGALSGDLDPWPMDQRTGRNAGPMGVGFRDEFHSRLKFNRRGLLGMANESTPNTNGSQFFFTLDKAEELNGKNTLFGRIEGDTIYNLAKMGAAEVEEGTDRPLYPVKVTRLEIVVNPFTDLKKRSRVAQQSQRTVVVDRKKKRKGGKQLLSFGDEEGEAEEAPAFKKKKFDTRIVMDVDEEEEAPTKKAPKADVKAASKKEEQLATKPIPVRDSSEEDERRSAPPVAPARKEKERNPAYDSPSPEPEVPKKKTAIEQTNEEIAALKASMRRTIHTEAEQPKKKSALESMIPETSIRGRKRRPGGQNTTASEDQKALDLLKAFQAKLDQAPPEKDAAAPGRPGEDRGEGTDGSAAPAAQEKEAELCDLHFIANCQSCKSWDNAEKEEESDDEGWMSHALSFKADKLGKDLSYRKKAEDELVVIDPRVKALTLKEEKRAKREARAGNSGRAWDQARDQAKNRELAKLSSLAGRGAR